MAEKHRLRLNRAGTIINLTSKQQESAIGQALEQTMVRVLDEFGLQLRHRKSIPLNEIVGRLRRDFPEVALWVVVRREVDTAVLRAFTAPRWRTHFINPTRIDHIIGRPLARAMRLPHTTTLFDTRLLG